MIQPPHDPELGGGAKDPAQHEGEKRSHDCRQRKIGGNQRGIGADGHERSMGKIDDLHHPEYDQQAAGDDKQDRCGSENIQRQCDHEVLLRKLCRLRGPMLPAGGTTRPQDFRFGH